MVFSEALERLWPNQAYALQIFATDLDPYAIVHARQGLYPEKITAEVSPERLRRFFTKEEMGGYRIGREIRAMTIFAPQDLIQDSPFTKIDLLICRNLLIYMTAALQRKLMALFHYSLNPGGVLFLGSAETVSSSAEMFTTLDGKGRFYQREILNTQVKPMTFSLAPPAGTGPSRHQPAGPIRAGAVTALLPRGGARPSQWRHPLHQWADRQVSGAAEWAGSTGTSSPWPGRGWERCCRPCPAGSARARRRAHRPARPARQDQR